MPVSSLKPTGNVCNIDILPVRHLEMATCYDSWFVHGTLTTNSSEWTLLKDFLVILKRMTRCIMMFVIV